MSLEEYQKRIDKLNQKKEKKKDQERQIRFLEMMASPHGDSYKKCYDMLTEFERQQGGKTFEIGMRLALEKLEKIELDEEQLAQSG